jgi:hypothetical protein
MKVASTMLFMAIIAISLLVPGCKKYHDYPGQPQPCKILKMKGLARYGLDSLIFTYNKKGLPVTITKQNVSTGNPSYWFRYDKQDRLKDMIGVYENSAPFQNGIAFEYWHRYGHDNKNRIATDSLFVMGIVQENPEAWLETTRTFKYDAQNRIISGTVKSEHDQEVTPWALKYDANGNAQPIDGPPLKYDNKINMHRIHPLWQFLHSDYSNNNLLTSVQPTAYNEYGLPTNYKAPQHGDLRGYFFFLYDQFEEVEITYSCQ